jgi:hypothetical protein
MLNNMRITLLQRPGLISANDFAVILEEELSHLKGDLSASIRFVGFSKRGWATIDVTGEDSEIVSELISRTLGLARTTLSDIQRHGNYEGLVNVGSAGYLEVDIGIEKPKPLKVMVKLDSLRAQLCDGKPLPIKEIVEHYCLYPNSKVTTRVTTLEPGAGVIEGCLADSQISLFSDWIATRCDRILAFDCSQRELALAIQKAHLHRDIISTDPITLTTHSILCKLGTDAIGLIPKLGSILRKRQLQPFIPKRILAKCRQW